MRREWSQRIVPVPRTGCPTVLDQRPERDETGHRGREEPLQPSRRADANQVTHDEPEVEATGMNQEALQNVRVTPQVRPPHPTGVIEMRKRTLDPLAALAHQSASPSAANASAIGIH